MVSAATAHSSSPFWPASGFPGPVAAGHAPDRTGSWPTRPLDRVGVWHPANFTDKVILRRCPACGERNNVRDNDFTCALCNSSLPKQWNFTSD
jgi:hypothetical protein